MPIPPAALTATLSTVRDLCISQFAHVRQEGDLVCFDYLAGPIPFGGYVEVNADLGACLFRAVLQGNIESDNRGRAMEYITRVNYELPAGSWTIDLESGEVRWKSGFFFGEVAPGKDLIYELLASSKSFIYRYVFGLVAIAVGKTVEEGMAQIGSDHGIGKFADE